MKTRAFLQFFIRKTRKIATLIFCRFLYSISRHPSCQIFRSCLCGVRWAFYWKFSKKFLKMKVFSSFCSIFAAFPTVIYFYFDCQQAQLSSKCSRQRNPMYRSCEVSCTVHESLFPFCWEEKSEKFDFDRLLANSETFCLGDGNFYFVIQFIKKTLKSVKLKLSKFHSSSYDADYAKHQCHCTSYIILQTLK